MISSNNTVVELSRGLIAGSVRFDDVSRAIGENPVLVDLGSGAAFVAGRTTSSIFTTAEGLVVVDTGGYALRLPEGGHMSSTIAAWSGAPVDTVVLTQLASDKVRGMPHLASAGAAARIVAHEAYERNQALRERLWSFDNDALGRQFQATQGHLQSSFVHPTEVYSGSAGLVVGERAFRLHHARGETDDQTWVWEPGTGILCAGDLVSSAAPNAGNPQRPIRYASDWAAACRAMLALKPEVLLPGHWIPFFGKDAARVLESTAEYLERICETVISFANRGAALHEVVVELRSEKYLSDLPFLTAAYDLPEFVGRNVWNELCGWYGQEPSLLRPPARSAMVAEISSLVGGPDQLVEAARRRFRLGDDESLRVASVLIDLAVDQPGVQDAAHELRSDIYLERAQREPAGVARGIFVDAANRSRHVLGLPETFVEHQASGSRVGFES